MRTLLLILLAYPLFAAECDPSYSHKDFTGQDLSDRNLDGLTICGSCFSQETPDRHIFSDKMTGVTFLWCNLDNVYIPPGNTAKNCSQRIFKAQPDGEDWILDSATKTTPLYRLKDTPTVEAQPVEVVPQ